MATGRPVSLASPSVLTLYRHETDYSGHLVIAVSQSGQTPEIVEVLRHARAAGARTVAITNDATSPLAKTADLPVILGAGEELAVPATKTVTAQFTAFAVIAQSLGEIGLSDEIAEALPNQVAEVLADLSPAAALAEWLANADRLVTLARGLVLGAAREAALKIAETTSMLTTGFSSADLRHGPIAIASRRPPFIAFAHPGPASADVLEAVHELRARGASVRVVGPVEGSDMSWPAAAPEILAPVLAVVRGQQIALSLSRLLGRDPDAPPGLSKVTPT
jgi:glucosamine--fructose-6-phosphate aminotransferase (isomerizing)